MYFVDPRELYEKELLMQNDILTKVRGLLVATEDRILVLCQLLSHLEKSIEEGSVKEWTLFWRDTANLVHNVCDCS